MKLQVLISTMNQDARKLINRMNVKSDAIVINQSNFAGYEEFEQKGRNILFISMPEKGVGLSRNMALSRAEADICLTADDDVVYSDSYEDLVLEAFRKYPKADMLIFNLISTNPQRPTAAPIRATRVRWYNSLRYGAFQFAFRLESVRSANIHYSLLFGGGARHSSGEDSIFISDCLRKGLRVYALPVEIGVVKQENSTWFKGYSDKFFKDKGALFATITTRFAYLLAIQFVVRKRRTFTTDLTLWQITKLLMAGIREVKR